MTSLEIKEAREMMARQRKTHATEKTEQEDQKLASAVQKTFQQQSMQMKLAYSSPAPEQTEAKVEMLLLGRILGMGELADQVEISQSAQAKLRASPHLEMQSMESLASAAEARVAKEAMALEAQAEGRAGTQQKRVAR